MSLESDLFAYLRPAEEALESYGFVRDNGEYVLNGTLIPDEFSYCIAVNENGTVRGSVTDLFSGEEYVPLRLPGQTGPYVTRVKEIYLDLLEDIAAKCFHPVDFASDQANRLAAWAEDTYGDLIDHPFEKEKEYGVLRAAGSKKWYALIMHIPYDKFTAQEGSTDVVNVKIRPEEKEALLQKEGFYPAWHMNRTHWMTIVLDETVNDDVVKERLRISRALTAGKKNADTAAHTWIIPSNPNMWDIIGAMKRSDDLWWKQHRNVQKGDTVYIYVGAPYSAILYAYTVTEADVPSMYDFGKNYPYQMRLHCTHRFSEEDLPFALLKEYGVTAVRGPRTIPQKLADMIRTRFG